MTPTIAHAETRWYADQRALTDLIDEAAEVLGSLVFPLNKFTRRCAALHGSSLHMPGVIKAMTTGWKHKKIFAAKLAGGKRDHAVCLAIDVSTSMLGPASAARWRAIVVLVTALRHIAVESISIVVFGRSVRLIKTVDQEWDARVVYTLIKELQSTVDDDTKDAHGIEVAIDVLAHQTSRGEKKLFVLTDGYGSCGLHCALAQKRAEEQGIDVVALAVGIERANVKNVYRRYLQCNSVYALSRSLRALFEGDSASATNAWTPHVTYPEVDLDRSALAGLFETLQSQKVFASMIEELAGQRDVRLAPLDSQHAHLSIDICFCLDCTGSMLRWMNAIKAQMKEIIAGVQTKIKENHPKLNVQLHIAVVGYRDDGDEPQFYTQDFTDNVDHVHDYVQKLSASGGGDLPEDVLGALHTCMTLPGWKGNHGRFIVLITDAPGHGDLSDALDDDHPQVTIFHLTVRTKERRLPVGLWFAYRGTNLRSAALEELRCGSDPLLDPEGSNAQDAAGLRRLLRREARHDGQDLHRRLPVRGRPSAHRIVAFSLRSRRVGLDGTVLERRSESSSRVLATSTKQSSLRRCVQCRAVQS